MPICGSGFLWLIRQKGHCLSVPLFLPLPWLYSRSGGFCTARRWRRSRSLGITRAQRFRCSRCLRRSRRRCTLGRRIVILQILLRSRRHDDGTGAFRAWSKRTGRCGLRDCNRSRCRFRTWAKSLCRLHGSHIRRTAWTTAFVRRRLRRISVRRICRCNRITICIR